MQKIGILTSGGDSSSMNMVISTIAKYLDSSKYEIVLIHQGYKGVYEKQFTKANLNEIATWYEYRGSKIESARFPEIIEPKYHEQMVKNLNEANISHLVVIGGDGSYKGALLLSKKGIKTYCLPGTIDNDVSSSKYSIGFDTSLNYIVESLKAIKSCMYSHSNTALVEVMGRHCIDLSIYSGIAVNADYVLTPFNHKEPEELLALIKKIRQTKKTGAIVIPYVENYLGKENYKPVSEYKKYIETNSDELVKLNVLGYAQRGGSPSAMDLFRTALMAKYTVSLIEKNIANKVICNDDTKIFDLDLQEAIDMKKQNRLDLLQSFFNI